MAEVGGGSEGCELSVVSCQLWVDSCQLWVDSCGLIVVGCEVEGLEEITRIHFK